ncbi:MAG TPA: glycosyltransferase family 4 protein, partial [Bryobacteraceae bacterium]|nr:glycosyltransferase family 4 protein [Bryobacteraceae bacterium]
GRYRKLASVLFEHDISFQSIARRMGAGGGGTRLKAGFEYLRTLRYELGILPRMDRIQVCSRENKEYLASFLPKLDSRIETGLRAGIDTGSYCFRTQEREPFTMLFLGSFRHPPNLAALDWFLEKVLPLVTVECAAARLVVVGSEMPAAHSLPQSSAIELRGRVEDAREPLGRYSLFVCPVLSGSGVRVKLLEAFAAGIPAVSTTLGAEGLTLTDGELCALADDPAAFAAKIVDLFHHPEKAAAMAARARREAETVWDIRAATGRLVESYREALREKRGGARAGATIPLAAAGSRR